MRRRELLFLSSLCLAASTFLTACGHLTVVRGSTSAETAAPDSLLPKTYPLDAYFFGIWEEEKLPPERKLCPSSTIDVVELEMNTREVLLSIVTLGTYTPHLATVTCARAAESP